MELENIVSRMNAIEEQIRSLNKSLIASNARSNEVDEKANNFLSIVREQKKEIARLNSTIMSLGKFDATINQVRTDFNRKMDEVETQRKQEEQIRSNMLNKDLKNLQSQFEILKKEIRNDYEKRFTDFIEEDSRVVTRFKEIEEIITNKIVSIEELKTAMSTAQQDIRRSEKQVESLRVDQDLIRDSQNDVRMKIETMMDSMRNAETRLNELVASESERRKNQLDFMQKQLELAGDRDKKWTEWNREFDHTLNQVREVLPEIQKQQYSMQQTKSDFDSISQQFERRIKEITEMYRLMEERYKKEWETFRADSEKRWSNTSLILEDKQGGYSEKLSALQERLLLVEDNNHEMQEALLLMSTEIQKGMQNIMKMVNGWMEAFGQISSSQ